MLCQLQVYSKVSQTCIYIYLLFFGFFSHIIHYRVLSRVPCAGHQQVLLVTYSICNNECMSVPFSQFIPPLFLYPGNHKFVFYVCCSISVLQISSFVQRLLLFFFEDSRLFFLLIVSLPPPLPPSMFSLIQKNHLIFLEVNFSEKKMYTVFLNINYVL